MSTRRGIAPHDLGMRTRAPPVAARALTAEQTAWLLVVPAVAVALLVVALLGPPLGRFAFTGARYHYWPSAITEQVRPKPAELARFALTVACALAFAAVVPAAVRRAPRLGPAAARAGVVGAQLLVVTALVLCFVAQRDVDPYEIGDPTYFAPLAIAVALVLAALGAGALAQPRVIDRMRTVLARGARSRTCVLLAALATVAWLLPSVFTDANAAYMYPLAGGHMQFAFDEAMSVLDGRSPLVNMTTYGALIPYLIALPLAAFHGSLAAFTTLMTALTAVCFLAVFALLRRLTRSALAALLLYLPFLATSLFIVRGESVERFTFGNYFGMFPIRYAGPYLLAWLTVRHLDGDRPRSSLPLFAAAGLVVLNNTDFGLPALGATLVAVLCARPPRDRAALLDLAGRLLAGLAVAFALVSVLTLAREGTLPHLDRITGYARLIGFAGYGNLPTPLLGFHLVILATYVAAAATAAVRFARRDPDPSLTGMLAWCGVFGLGTGAYFVYRSHPDTLIASFSIWSLTLALLLVAYVRGAAGGGALNPSPAGLALLAACGLAVCSLPQLPPPWQQVERLRRTSPEHVLEWPQARAFVRAHVQPGSTVAILASLGHRIAYDAGVRNVMAYTGMRQMPTAEQLRETVGALRAAGGDLLFLSELHQPEIPGALEQLGFTLVAQDQASEYSLWRDDGR